MTIEITSRDYFIIGHALYRYVQHEQQKPTNLQSQSDIQDTKDVLLRTYPHVAEIMIESDRATGRTPANLMDEM